MIYTVNGKARPGLTVGPIPEQTRRLDASSNTNVLLSPEAVRRITPTEAERLMGFPDGYTAIPGASDTARYTALGNSIPPPMLTWLGQRMQRVSALITREHEHGRNAR